jgi:hypothetical protein
MLAARGSVFAHPATPPGSRRSAPTAMSGAARNAGGLRTSMTSGGCLSARTDFSSDAVIDVLICAPFQM